MTVFQILMWLINVSNLVGLSLRVLEKKLSQASMNKTDLFVLLPSERSKVKLMHVNKVSHTLRIYLSKRIVIEKEDRTVECGINSVKSEKVIIEFY